MERNGDVVCMTSYAPLFAKKNHHSWDPDLIYFDNERTYLTCSYYVQQMFGQSSGQYFYGDCVDIEGKTNLQEQSVVLNTKTRTLYVKVCNASNEAKNVNLNLSRFGSLKNVTATTLTGKPEQENNYESQPIQPQVQSIKLKAKDKMEIPAYSFVMLTIKL